MPRALLESGALDEGEIALIDCTIPNSKDINEMG